MQRVTSQKQIIEDYLSSVKTHPTADKVYSEVKKKLPRISKATIYRVLKDFKRRGRAQVISVKGTSHFDADTSSHAHYICHECNRVYDVSDVCSDCEIIQNKKTKVGKIKRYKVYFYGTCKNCSKK